MSKFEETIWCSMSMLPLLIKQKTTGKVVTQATKLAEQEAESKRLAEEARQAEVAR